METKFKKGDKVKIIQRKPGNRTGLADYKLPNGDVGKIGYVVSITLSSETYDINSEIDDSGTYYGWFDDDDLELVSEKPNFIIGKWYKGEGGNYYIKFKSLESLTLNNRIYYSERIYDEEYQKINDYWANDDFERYALSNPVDLSEIQQYLPPDHPDKQIKTMEKNEFKKGDYIVTLEGDFSGRYLKALVDNPYSIGYAKKDDYFKIVDSEQCILINDDSTWNYSEGNYEIHKDFELMPEEFTPPTKTKDLLSEAKRRYPVGTKFKSPQNLGIFTVETYNNLHSHWIGDNYLIIHVGNSNKGEYLCNNGVWAEIIEEIKSEEWIPKVGDWIVVLKSDPYNEGKDFVAQISNFNNKSSYWVKNQQNLTTKYKTYNELCCDCHSFRKALPHEIPSNIKNPCLEINIPMKNYTAEEALAELKRRGFKEGCKYYCRYENGEIDKNSVYTASKDPEIQGCNNSFIDCGGGYLWSKYYPHLLHEGPISEEFVLPEKWCIYANKDNIDVIANFYNTANRKYKLDTYDKSHVNRYFSSHNLSGGQSIFSDNPASNYTYKLKTQYPGYTEITFEQFKKYVLKQDLIQLQFEALTPKVFKKGPDRGSVIFFYELVFGKPEEKEQDYSKPESLLKKPMLL